MLLTLGIDAQRHQDDALVGMPSIITTGRSSLASEHDSLSSNCAWVRATQRRDTALLDTERGNSGGGSSSSVQAQRRVDTPAAIEAIVAIQRISLRGPGEVGQLQLATPQAARPRSRLGDSDALAAQHDTGSRRAAAQSPALRFGHVLGATQRHPVGFHHGRQHLLAGADTPTVERMLLEGRNVPDKGRINGGFLSATHGS